MSGPDKQHIVVGFLNSRFQKKKKEMFTEYLDFDLWILEHSRYVLSAGTLVLYRRFTKVAVNYNLVPTMGTSIA
jgi:hypothetical protein